MKKKMVFSFTINFTHLVVIFNVMLEVVCAIKFLIKQLIIVYEKYHCLILLKLKKICNNGKKYLRESRSFHTPLLCHD